MATDSRFWILDSGFWILQMADVIQILTRNTEMLEENYSGKGEALPGKWIQNWRTLMPRDEEIHH